MLDEYRVSGVLAALYNKKGLAAAVDLIPTNRNPDQLGRVGK